MEWWRLTGDFLDIKLETTSDSCQNLDYWSVMKYFLDKKNFFWRWTFEFHHLPECGFLFKNREQPEQSLFPLEMLNCRSFKFYNFISWSKILSNKPSSWFFKQKSRMISNVSWDKIHKDLISWFIVVSSDAQLLVNILKQRFSIPKKNVSEALKVRKERERSQNCSL